MTLSTGSTLGIATTTTTAATKTSSSLTKHIRRRLTCTPKWQRYQQSKSSGSRQYSHVYHERLVALGPVCWQHPVVVQLLEQGPVRVGRILELSLEVDSLVVGTLVEEEVFYLEDDSARVALEWNQQHNWCTGVVVALRGQVDESGAFQVSAVFPPNPLPDLIHTNPAPPTDNNGSYLLLLSGLHGSDDSSVNSSLALQELLLPYLQGYLDSPDSSVPASNIAQVIIAGAAASHSDDMDALRDLDGWIRAVTATGLPVHLMPGQYDPVTAQWPQRPFHSSLLPHNKSGSRLLCTPNPYAAQYTVHPDAAPQLVVGTDGRNIQDLVQRKGGTELDALRQTLEWSHLCPTGPDNIPTIPDADPMVLQQRRPHLYFGGNCTGFATALVPWSEQEATRLVCIPQFHATGQAVLVHLPSLHVQLLQFAA
jgi:DNA polymerase delta subunit 2